jgi:hypothetical protein
MELNALEPLAESFLRELEAILLPGEPSLRCFTHLMCLSLRNSTEAGAWKLEALSLPRAPNWRFFFDQMSLLVWN